MKALKRAFCGICRGADRPDPPYFGFSKTEIVDLTKAAVGFTNKFWD